MKINQTPCIHNVDLKKKKDLFISTSLYQLEFCNSYAEEISPHFYFVL